MSLEFSGDTPVTKPLPIVRSNNAVQRIGGTSASASSRRVGSVYGAYSPRISNTGGNPETGISGESLTSEVAHVDWFACSCSPAHGDSEELILSGAITGLLELLNIEMSQCVDTGKGWNGYRTRIDLGGYGLLAYGGESQRGSFHVELNGSGCARVSDWSAVAEWGQRTRAKITRVDLAHDDFEGKTVNIEILRQWHESGAFTSNGRPPDAHLRDDLGSGKGKTLYVGNRANGKLLRGYEKGKQLGDVASQWFRVEVELKGKARTIPWDVLTNPSAYLAGAFPCLAFLSTVQSKIKTISKAVSISLDTAIRNGRIAVGKLVNVMMRFHVGDAFAVVDDLSRDGIPRRLENFRDFLWPPCVEGSP